jgi:hypothetical protein
MIPEFPKFKRLELSDKEEVEKITSKFPPYSDFNFVSMWSWDTKGEMRLSILNENLVVSFTDYLTGKPFLSFIGENKIQETAIELITFSKNNYYTNLLRLIPGEVASTLDKSGFGVLPDVNSIDYVYRVEELKNMHNWAGHKVSKGIKKFLKLHPDYLVKISSLKEIPKNEYMEIFGKWAKQKHLKDYTELNEYKAFKRFLEIKNENIEVVSLYKNKQLIGFTTYEILSEDYAVAHFSKADIEHHSSTYDILIWEEVKALNIKKVKYYNWEQDLGLQGLQSAKTKYKPCFFLSKFIVRI